MESFKNYNWSKCLTKKTNLNSLGQVRGTPLFHRDKSKARLTHLWTIQLKQYMAGEEG